MSICRPFGKTPDDEDVSMVLSSTDIAEILNTAQPEDILENNMHTQNLMTDNFENPAQDLNLVDSTCGLKQIPLDGEVLVPVTDEFVHLTPQPDPLTNTVIPDNEEVCKQITVNSVSDCTNIVTSMANVLNQISHMTLIDTENYKASTAQGLALHNLQQLSGTSASDGEKLIQMYTPVEVLTGTTNAPQMYILSMTFEDSSTSNQEEESTRSSG